MMNVPGGPTPAEVMAVSLLKLGVRSGDVAADLGCGTGTVTREIAKTASYVYAVDAREIAVSCTKETCAGLPVEIIEGEVTDFLSRPHRKNRLRISWREQKSRRDADAPCRRRHQKHCCQCGSVRDCLSGD